MRTSGFALLRIILVSVLLNVALVAAIVAAQDEPPHWTYEGEKGPEHWGNLSPDYAACSVGEAQSPINIADPVEASLVNISFDYQESALNIFNNGHTIQVNYDEGSSITYNEDIYVLKQFHFHHPSEHSINGVPADMEIHFVHADAADNLAVVGVMLVEGDVANADYSVVFDNLPPEKGEPQATDLSINAANMLPDTQTYFTYRGSLTTPPCTEGVRWLLLQTPITVSHEAIEAFNALFENNARPVQMLNVRDLLADTSE